MRKVCLLCTLLLATGMVLAQTTATKSQSAQGPMVPTTAYRTGAQGFIGDGDALGVPAFAGDDNARGGETFCPTGYLAGQGPGACGSTQWYFYDDLMFCVTPPTTCKRVRCENFPDPTHTITKAIGVVMWTGLYVDDNQDGCTKPEHLFRVRFYTGAAPDPNNPYYSEEHDALATDTGRTVSFSGHAAATVWQFTFVLDNPVNLQTGWFAVTGDGTAGCYHLWEGSAEGNNSFYQWSEQPPGTGYSQNTTLCDLTYCLSEKKIGACCDECAGSQDPVGACTDNVSDVYCAGIGGRWVQNTACSAISPPCGQQTGACCHDDGTCTLELCCDCEPGHVGCEAPKCVGDMNCDGFINFSDINPFVMYMSNIALWQSTYPGCNPKNGDINCDGNYGQASFSDINPFVHIMTLCGSGCTCPGPGCQSTPRNQGDYWAGPATTCDPYPVGGCCTVVIDPNTPGGLHLENEPNNCAPDVYNGGCNITPALFTPIQNGWTIYGQSGTFTAGNPPNSYRDMDWYQVTVNNATSFTVTVEAEFDAIVWADRAGPDPNNPCDGYHDVADVIAPPAGTHNLCTPLVLTTRCLPAGTYWFIVAPANFSGVACGADYKITLQVGAPCEVQNHCADCPGGATYVEGAADGVPGYCQVDPNDPTYDPYNGGCSNTPTGPFELLPHDPNTNPDTFTFCGKVWATGGARDLDWWDLELPVNSQISYTVTTEVPVQAIMLSGDGNFGPSTCDALWGYWGSTWFSPCLPTPFNDTTYYQAGPHYFLVMPTADANQTPIWYGYPCPMGTADLGNDYTITMTVTGIDCENEILAKTAPNLENESNCSNPLTYVDSYNGGCDAGTPYHYQILNFNAANAWRGRTFAVTDPNQAVKKDYDWYQFSWSTGNQKFKVYLYADFPATWEIWPANNCTAGPIEGVQVPSCNDAGVLTRRCYAAGTYWLRVYPTSVTTCGKYYYLALTEPATCSQCGFSASGTNLDDPCDDVTDYDTNAGCDDPNAPPPHFMPFVAPYPYWGYIYAGLVTGAPYYDPDWFTITNTYTNARKLKLTVQAEFLAHVEVYLSCTDYDSGNSVLGLDGVTPNPASGCPNEILTETTNGGSGPGTVYYGRITCVDQFGNLMTAYYPCAKGNNRWKVTPTFLLP